MILMLLGLDVDQDGAADVRRRPIPGAVHAVVLGAHH